MLKFSKARLVEWWTDAPSLHWIRSSPTFPTNLNQAAALAATSCVIRMTSKCQGSLLSTVLTTPTSRNLGKKWSLWCWLSPVVACWRHDCRSQRFSPPLPQPAPDTWGRPITPLAHPELPSLHPPFFAWWPGRCANHSKTTSVQLGKQPTTVDTLQEFIAMALAVPVMTWYSKRSQDWCENMLGWAPLCISWSMFICTITGRQWVFLLRNTVMVGSGPNISRN